MATAFSQPLATIREMRTWTTILTLLTILTAWTTLQAQDGSDIMYGKIDQLDSSFIGDYAHLDFYRKSMFGRNIDTVTVDLDGQQIRFVEHRIDNGYNNWFKDQYLETLDKIDRLTIRIVKCRLDSITTDSFFVTNYLEYYDDKNNLIADKSRQIMSSFPRDIIAEVLISAKHHNERKK